MTYSYSEFGNATVNDGGWPRPAIYKATRISDGFHYMEVRMGPFKKRKYINPEDVTFKQKVTLIMVEKVGRYGEVPA